MEQYDPVLEQHMVMAGGENALPAGPSAEHFPIESLNPENVSRQVPLILAVGAVTAVGVLFAMRAAGIRFAFGANLGSA
jgi:hypothetical protein